MEMILLALGCIILFSAYKVGGYIALLIAGVVSFIVIFITTAFMREEQAKHGRD